MTSNVNMSDEDLKLIEETLNMKHKNQCTGLYSNIPHPDGPRKQRRKKIKNRCKRIKIGRK